MEGYWVFLGNDFDGSSGDAQHGLALEATEEMAGQVYLQWAVAKMTRPQPCS